jgi:hypothetical protein
MRRAVVCLAIIEAVRRRKIREPSHRRYGVIYRPSGRPGWTRLDWVNDGGRDEPLSSRDARVLIAWGIALLVVAFAVAAVATYFF